MVTIDGTKSNVEVLTRLDCWVHDWMKSLVFSSKRPLISQPRQRTFRRLSAAEMRTIQIGFH